MYESRSCSANFQDQLTEVPLPHAVSSASPPLLSFDVQVQLLLLQLPLPCGAKPPAQHSTLFLDQL
jgi:hypothetical protein